MALVSYSDSEGSEDEHSQPKLVPQQQPSKPFQPRSTTAFSIDKSNPRKIRVNLPEPSRPTPTTDDVDGEPAPKRARTGGGVFSGFNSMLPAPKRDTQVNGSVTSGFKKPARKVFSLKTSAEPAFSRESNSELDELFAGESDQKSGSGDSHLSNSATFIAPASTGNPMVFKPLSVARNVQKKKKTTSTNLSKPASRPPGPSIVAQEKPATPKQPPAPPKVSLFSTSRTEIDPESEPRDEPEHDDFALMDSEDPLDIPDLEAPIPPAIHIPAAPDPSQPTQSLESIASDLNLSASARRQLLGRNPKSTSSAINVVNFNTDIEYAANEVLRASGDQVQHNPVRAIAPGKHSLKQLVSAASGQKDALEESFASGKRNKREAGNKYGW